MRQRMVFLFCVAVVGVLLSYTPAASDDFYKGKTVRVIVGSAPGGGYDTYARLIARHLSKHIPGNPKTLVINMPGASGLIAANYLYNLAKPDGTTISHVNWTIPQMEFLGIPAVKYKAANFEWLGLANSSVITVAVGKKAPVQTLKAWLDPSTKPLVFGCNTRSGLTCSTALAVNDIFGPVSKIVPGFAGTALMRAAIVRGETDAVTGWTWDSVKATGMSMINDGDLKLLAYLGDSRNAELDERKVPYLNELVTKPEDKAFLNILTMPATMVRPWATVPKTPKDRVAVLKTALMETLKDPELLKEAKKLRVDISPKSAEWLTNFIRNTQAELKPSVRERARKLLGLE